MPEYRDEGFVGEFWGSAGTGILFQARNTGRYLLLKRSALVEDPGLWGIPGGAVPVDARGRHMDLWAAARRETLEETGRRVGARAKRIGQYTWEAPRGTFRYTTFVVEVAREFRPRLNWESSRWAWVDSTFAGSRDIHPGVAWVVAQIRSHRGSPSASRTPRGQSARTKGGIGKRLDWIESRWGVDVDDDDGVYWAFLLWLRSAENLPHLAGAGSRKEWRTALGKEPPRVTDKFVPWLWREWIQALKRREAGQTRDITPPRNWPLIRDWVLATHPDLGRLGWADAYSQAIIYHDDLEERADRKKWVKAWKRNKSRALGSFRRVLSFEDGVWLGYFDHKVRGLAPLQMVGALLRHCYVDANNAIHYGGWDPGGGGILVLFGPDDEPAVSLAYRELGGPDSVVFDEVRGVQNRFPSSRWWPYIARVLFGDASEARRFEELPSWVDVARTPQGRILFKDAPPHLSAGFNFRLFFSPDEIDPAWTPEEEFTALRAEGWSSTFLAGSSYTGLISRRAWWF